MPGDSQQFGPPPAPKIDIEALKKSLPEGFLSMLEGLETGIEYDRDRLRAQFQIEDKKEEKEDLWPLHSIQDLWPYLLSCRAAHLIKFTINKGSKPELNTITFTEVPQKAQKVVDPGDSATEKNRSRNKEIKRRASTLDKKLRILEEFLNDPQKLTDFRYGWEELKKSLKLPEEYDEYAITDKDRLLAKIKSTRKELEPFTFDGQIEIIKKAMENSGKPLLTMQQMAELTRKSLPEQNLSYKEAENLVCSTVDKRGHYFGISIQGVNTQRKKYYLQAETK